MGNKSTDDLREELMSEAGIDAYIKGNDQLFFEAGIIPPLQTLFERQGSTKTALAKRAAMSEVYVYQVFSGRRTPSRDRLFCLCAGLEATLEETQELLDRAGYARLYPRSKRDAILIHGLAHRTPLEEINDKLYQENETTLF